MQSVHAAINVISNYVSKQVLELLNMFFYFFFLVEVEEDLDTAVRIIQEATQDDTAVGMGEQF